MLEAGLEVYINVALRVLTDIGLTVSGRPRFSGTISERSMISTYFLDLFFCDRLMEKKGVVEFRHMRSGF